MTLFGWPSVKEIVDLDAPDEVYLRRTQLFKSRWLAVYVHRILRPDVARCAHGHPWPFLTMILRGGYVEEIGGKRYARRPGYVGWRPRAFQHRIVELPHGPALTLVIRGRDHGAWNFYDADGQNPIPWQVYCDMPQRSRILWCEEGAGPAAALRAMAAELDYLRETGFLGGEKA